MKILEIKTVEVSGEEIFEIDGIKFAVLPNGDVYHYDSGFPWKHNGEHPAERSKRIFEKQYERLPEAGKKFMLNRLTTAEKIND